MSRPGEASLPLRRALFLFVQLSARLTRRSYLTSRAALLVLGIGLLAGVPFSIRYSLGLSHTLTALGTDASEAYLSTLLGVLFCGSTRSCCRGGYSDLSKK
ncbi:MAG: hypothetical protein QM758_02835 [Armatimonas sp.]